MEGFNMRKRKNNLKLQSKKRHKNKELENSRESNKDGDEREE